MGRVVLILDDMWVGYNAFTIGIPVGENKWKIIMSSPSMDVCRKMTSDQYILPVEPLLSNEAWELFFKTLNNQEQLTKEIEDVVKVVEVCGGLPLALIHVASNIKRVYDVHEWNTALNVLKSIIIYDNEYEDVFRALRFSYDRLRNDIERRCFLTCLLYEEDKPLKKEELIEVWILEGLIDCDGNKECLVSWGHTIINKVLASCLLIRDPFGDDNYVSMHGLVRSMGILITQKDPHFIAQAGKCLHEVPDEERWHDVVNVSFRDNQIREIPTDMAPNCSKQLTLLTLYTNPLKKIPDSFFAHMQTLRILDLSYTDIRRLPKSVSGLENLRALLLKGCGYLELSHDVELPTKLKVLDFVESFQVIAPCGMERLTKLEKLWFCRWTATDLTNFNNFVACSQIFRKLSLYVLILADNYFYDYYNYGMFQVNNMLSFAEKAIWVKNLMLSQVQSSISLPATVEVIQIANCSFGRGYVFPGVGGASSLTKLYIKDCEGLEYVLQTERASSFCQLNELSLCMLLDLKGIIIMTESSIRIGISSTPTFFHLSSLEVYGCPKIEALFPAELVKLQHVLPGLETLDISFCKKMKVVLDSPAAFSYTTANFIISLPKLQNIQLYMLPELESIYRALLFCNSKLKLHIKDCSKLELMGSMRSLICDNSNSTLASIPLCTQDQEWWDTLRMHNQDDANTLRHRKHCESPRVDLKRKAKDEASSSTVDSICYAQKSSEDLNNEDGVRRKGKQLE